ncbi:MAG: peroxiredoxin family protein [Candidatus Binatia bacterium]
MNAKQAYPMPRSRLPDFALPSSEEGQRIDVSDYRGRRNLVVAFVGNPDRPPCRQLLSGLAQRYPEFVEEETKVLVAVRGSVHEAAQIKARYHLPFPVLADEDGQVFQAFGALTPYGAASMAVYITDRFGQVYWGYRIDEGQSPPRVEEVLEWAHFIELQCPECGAPEWPAE